MTEPSFCTLFSSLPLLYTGDPDVLFLIGSLKVILSSGVGRLGDDGGWYRLFLVSLRGGRGPDLPCYTFCLDLG